MVRRLEGDTCRTRVIIDEHKKLGTRGTHSGTASEVFQGPIGLVKRCILEEFEQISLLLTNIKLIR